MPSMLSSFLNPGRGYEKALQAMQNYYNQGQGYLSPYQQQGLDAYAGYRGAMDKLLDPTALQNEWIQSYEMSPQAQHAQALAKQQGLDAASSLGLSGSTTALDALQAGASQIALDDRQRYIDDLLKKYTLGTGIAGNIYGTGANTAQTMASNAMNMGQYAGDMEYGRQAAPGYLLERLLGLGGSLASGWLTGGQPGGQ